MATVEEAIDVLTRLGLPKAQLNERSALTLLALLDLWGSSAWTEARDPLRGITPLMDHMAAHYGKRYAPNTRETSADRRSISSKLPTLSFEIQTTRSVR